MHQLASYALRIARWNGPRTTGDSGVQAVSGQAQWILLEAQKAPSAQTTGALGVLLKTGHSWGSDVALSVRLAADQTSQGVAGVRVFVAARVFAEDLSAMNRLGSRVREFLMTGLPAGYRWVDRSTDAALVAHVCAVQGATSITEALPPERFLRAGIDPRICGYSLLYQLPGLMPHEHNLLDVCETMKRLGGRGPTVLDVTLVPAAPLTNIERAALDHWSDLATAFAKDQNLHLPGQFSRDGRFIPETVVAVPPDPNAGQTAQLFEALRGRRANTATPLFSLAVRIAGWGNDSTETALRLLVSKSFEGYAAAEWTYVTPTDIELIRRARDAVAGGFVSPSLCHSAWNLQDAPHELKRLHRLVSVSEVAGLFSLPTAQDGRWPGQIDLRPRRDHYNISDLLANCDEAWEHGTSAATLSTPVGWATESLDEYIFQLDSNERPHALIIGRSGSGKSSLLHALILGLTTRLPPKELELYLLDLKEGGVGFACYDSLPHARVVASSGDPIFALGVLRGLADELKRRGRLFRTNNAAHFGALRERRQLPRVLGIIDEFQKLFLHDEIATEARSLLDQIAAEGRSWGVHLVLASQSVTTTGSTALAARTIDQLSVRALLGISSKEDAHGLVSGGSIPDNGLLKGEALIARPGNSGSDRSSIVRVGYAQNDTMFESVRGDHLAAMRRLGSLHGCAGPTVFDGEQPADPQGVAAFASERHETSLCEVVLGQTVALSLQPFSLKLTAISGNNILLCCPEYDFAGRVMASVCASFVLSSGAPDRARLLIVDLDASAPWVGELSAKVSARSECASQSDFGELLDVLVAEVRARATGGAAKVPWLCIVSGLHAATSLNVQGHAASGDSELLREVLISGPAVGVHLLLWCTNDAAFRATVPPAAHESFVMVVAGHGVALLGLFGSKHTAPTPRAQRAVVRAGGEWMTLRAYDLSRWPDPTAATSTATRPPSWQRSVAFQEQEVPPLPRVLGDLLLGPFWDQYSIEGLAAPVGTMTSIPKVGAFVPRTLPEKPAVLRFEDDAPHALVGGAAGSGKSTLLHDLILSLCARYSPFELALYLVDMKRGVEFACYRALPHARAVAIEGNKTFAVSIVEELERECARRNDLFRNARAQNISQFRLRTGQHIPRILAIFDEFQVIFRDDGGDEAERFKRAVENVAKIGRSVGVHLLLATQSHQRYSHAWLTSSTVDQMPLRIAMRVPSTDALGDLLASQQQDAMTLEKRGEAVVEIHGQHHRLCSVFARDQPSFDQTRAGAIASFESWWASCESKPSWWHPPVVFDATQSPQALSNPNIAHAAKGVFPAHVTLYFGQAIDAVGTHVGLELKREDSENTLVYGTDRSTASAVLLGAVCSALVLGAGNIFLVSGRDSPWNTDMAWKTLLAQWSDKIVVKTLTRGTSVSELDPFIEEMQTRADGNEHYPSTLIVAWNTKAIVDLFEGPTGFSLEPPLREAWKRILSYGPDVGMHVLAWSDTQDGAAGLFSSDAVSDRFAVKILLMSGGVAEKRDQLSSRPLSFRPYAGFEQVNRRRS